MKNVKLVGLVVAALGALAMVGCAAQASPTDTQEQDPTAEVDTPAPKGEPKTPAEALESATKADVHTATVRGVCPPKPGIVRCSCGICAYENECRSLCGGGI